jgi:hypothetical protein
VCLKSQHTPPTKMAQLQLGTRRRIYVAFAASGCSIYRTLRSGTSKEAKIKSIFLSEAKMEAINERATTINEYLHDGGDGLRFELGVNVRLYTDVWDNHRVVHLRYFYDGERHTTCGAMLYADEWGKFLEVSRKHLEGTLDPTHYPGSEVITTNYEDPPEQALPKNTSATSSRAPNQPTSLGESKAQTPGTNQDPDIPPVEPWEEPTTSTGPPQTFQDPGFSNNQESGSYRDAAPGPRRQGVFNPGQDGSFPWNPLLKGGANVFFFL